jgi:hypothetical protein
MGKAGRAGKPRCAAVQIENAPRQRRDSLAIELSRGGGFIGRLEKKL